jgi:hypothetical protein
MFDWSRMMLRQWLFRFLQRIAATQDTKIMATDTLRGLLHWQPDIDPRYFKMAQPLYEDLGHSRREAQLAQHRDAIIITGRFRSGSTFLWNIFRHIEGMTTYYEPFNERRWFDSLARGDRLDQTHKHVEDYWREYDGLEMLCDYYREEWTYKNLFMGAAFWAPEMKRYVELLIEKAAGRPVLQFNRIDLRLQWFRYNFPHAKIIHIYRHPRDQWCSFLLDLQCFSKDGSMEQFAPHDKFYLRSWATDLQYHFPFLAEDRISHPYQMFYLLWKISYLWGINFSHYSIAFENLIDNFESVLNDLFYFLEIGNFNMEKLQSIISKPESGKWKKYANDTWFREHESICETILEDFFASLS